MGIEKILDAIKQAGMLILGIVVIALLILAVVTAITDDEPVSSAPRKPDPYYATSPKISFNNADYPIDACPEPGSPCDTKRTAAKFCEINGYHKATKVGDTTYTNETKYIYDLGHDACRGDKCWTIKYITCEGLIEQPPPQELKKSYPERVLRNLKKVFDWVVSR